MQMRMESSACHPSSEFPSDFRQFLMCSSSARVRCLNIDRPPVSSYRSYPKNFTAPWTGCPRDAMLRRGRRKIARRFLVGFADHGGVGAEATSSLNPRQRA